MVDRKRIVVIIGPTAGGKTALAVAVARAMGGEIISADSMQVYRGLEAGTAKPTEAERDPARGGAVHHLIDCVETTERFTAADWLARAEALIAGMHARGALPIVAGGTNLYIKALLEGMFEGPGADDAFRASLEGEASAALHERLRAVDPEAASRIDRNDRKRIVRALEVHHVTGTPITERQTHWAEGSTIEYRHDPIMIGLRWSVAGINRRIAQRAAGMFEPRDGGEDLVSETRRLLGAGLLGEQAREAIGTKQVLAYLRGERTLEQAREQVKIDTRRFAKGQRTWLKRYRGVHWIDAEALDESQRADAAIRIVRDELSGARDGRRCR